MKPHKADQLSRDSIWAHDIPVVDCLDKAATAVREIRKRPDSVLLPPRKKPKGPGLAKTDMAARLRAIAMNRGEYKVRP